MLISEFARAAGLPVDTVRYYIRRGLLTPEVDGRGGANPYQSFTDDDVATARFIRFAQALGMSLTEIAAVNEERRKGDMTPEQRITFLTGQREALICRMEEFSIMAEYLQSKIKWIEDGEKGPPPPWDHAVVRGRPLNARIGALQHNNLCDV